MTKRAFKNDPVPRVGVTIDCSNMSTDELCSALDASVGSYGSHLWDSCYAFSCLYRRPDEWTKGINSRTPTRDHFVFYCQQRFPHRCFTRNDIMTRVDIYLAYAEFGDDEIVNLIGQSGGLTKARFAIPYAIIHRDKVKDILRLCVQTPQNDLKDQLRRNYRINGRNLPETSTASSGDSISSPKVSPRSVIEFLAAGGFPIVAQKMFIPRHHQMEAATEWAWANIVKVYQDNNPTMSLDEVFAEMFARWVDAMTAEDRRDLLRTAFARWSHQIEPLGLTEADWPFDQPEDDHKAA